MRNLRTIQEIEEEYLRNHPDEVDDYIALLFEEYEESGDAASLLSSLQSVGRVTGHDAKGLQNAFVDQPSPLFESVSEVVHTLGYRLVPQRLDNAATH
jgi:DNA-binding phage protein